MLLKTYLFVFMLTAFTRETSVSDVKKITVIGTAWNAKGSAIVESNQGTYFLDGLDQWESQYYGKKVKVTGRLTTVTHKPASTYPGEFAEWSGTRKVIKKPKWSLTE